MDRYAECKPDVVANLEEPWPFEDNSAEEVVLIHVLEHVGETTDKYKTFWQELYRVCAPGAKILIHVPDPRHNDFLDDPTHIRAVTPRQFALFDQDFNARCEKEGFSDSQLGRSWGINFKILERSAQPSPVYLEANPAKAHDQRWLELQALTKLNQITQTMTVLECVK